jgi:hypothetical protein
LDEEEEDEDGDREVFLVWMTAGIVYWRDIMEGILMEFLRIERGREAVVTVVAKIREGGVAVTLVDK